MVSSTYATYSDDKSLYRFLRPYTTSTPRLLVTRWRHIKLHVLFGQKGEVFWKLSSNVNSQLSRTWFICGCNWMKTIQLKLVPWIDMLLIGFLCLVCPIPATIGSLNKQDPRMNHVRWFMGLFFFCLSR